jgi:hypothetical protein
MVSRYQRIVLIKEFLPSVLMAIVSLVLLFYAIIPGISHIQDLLRSSDTVNKENTVLKKKINILSSFDEETLGGYMSTLLSAVPADKSIASILTTIDSVAAKNNIMVTDLSILNPGSISSESASPKTSNTKLGSNTIRISAGIKGSETDIFSFISMIRKVRRLIRVATVSESYVGSESSPSASVKLDLEAFYAPLPKTLGKIEAEVLPLSANEELSVTKISEYPLEYNMVSSESQIQVESGNKIDPFSF